jgi:hypothetical protein
LLVTRSQFDRLLEVGRRLFPLLHAGVRFLLPEIADAKIDFLRSPAIEFLKMPTIKIPGDLNVQKSLLIEFNTGYPEAATFYDIANNRYPSVVDVFGGH